MRKSKIKQISLAVCLAVMPFVAYAAGLGKLNVNSSLGDPLKADIELLSVTPEELASLVATIASDDAYASQGITRLGIHNNIKIELSKNADGLPLIKLHSTQKINDPYLDMLIQLDWSAGRLQREYTILLDPPGYKNTADAVVPILILPPVINNLSSIAQSRNADLSDKEVSPRSLKAAKKLSKNRVSLADKNLLAVDDQDVITKRGDTLISVAKALQVEGVSLDQMLVGLYANNKNAFSRDNMNRLKVGQIIKLPAKDDLIAINEQQAKQTVKLQSANWNAYRNALAANVAKAPAKIEAEQKQSVSGKIASAEDNSAKTKAGPQDVVKLSAGEKESVSRGVEKSSKAADAKIIALQDEATAREKALKEAQERTSALEKQVQDMQKLLALKSQSMSKLQNDAEAAVKADAAKSKAADAILAEAAKAKEIVKVETAKAIEVKPQEVVAPLVSEPVFSAPTVVTEVKKVNPTPQPIKPEKIIPEPRPEVGFLESLINSVDFLLIGATSGLVLLIAGWLFLRNKRRKDLDSFERGILTSGGLRANTVFGNVTGNLGTSDTAFLTDFSQNSDGSMIDTNDVDPIAEAEVYMAYGRDAQAEEILKDAILKEPKRYELHVKLLEMYAARKDNSAFEAIAGELYTTLGADDPTWTKVAKMGVALEPENPLYDLSSVLAKTLLAEKNNASLEAVKPVNSADHIDANSTNLDFPVNVESPTLIADDKANSTSVSESESSKPDMSFDLSSLNIDNGQATLATDSTSSEPLINVPLDNSTEDHSFSPANIENEFSGNDISFEASSNNQAKEDYLPESNFKSETVDDNALNFDLGDLSLGALKQDDSVSAGIAQSKLTESESNLSAQPNVSDVLPALDSGLVASEDFSVKPIDISLLSENFSENIESTDVDFTKAHEEVKSILKPEAKLNALDDISFDMDFSLDEMVQQNEVSMKNAAVAKPLPEANDFNTEISSDSPEDEIAATKSASNTEDQDLEANSFDLSSINLDLGDTEIETFPDLSSPPALAETEPPDVNIKLDLVAAYIDMDDKDGAIELLEEVMKEGGVNQKARAKTLLDSLA